MTDAIEVDELETLDDEGGDLDPGDFAFRSVAVPWAIDPADLLDEDKPDPEPGTFAALLDRLDGPERRAVAEINRRRDVRRRWRFSPEQHEQLEHLRLTVAFGKAMPGVSNATLRAIAAPDPRGVAAREGYAL